MNQKLERVIDIVTIGIIIFLLLSIIYAGTLHPFKVVLTQSMEPVLNPGDIIYVKKVDDPNTLSQGDIVVYTRPDFKLPIVHRIISVSSIGNEKCFVIKGDNNSVTDPPYVYKGHTYNCVPGTAIEAKYIYKIPWIGKPFVWIYEKR